MGLGAIILGTVAWSAADAWWHGSGGFHVRLAIARWNGYDGCTCSDCAEAFGFGPAPRRHWDSPWTICGCGRRAESDMRAVAGAIGLALILGGRFLPVVPPMRGERRRAKGLCPSCGYDMSGLPGPRCPECGAEGAPERA